MIYSLLKSFGIMLNAHWRQFDKGGRWYIFHPLTVALHVKGLRAKSVALVHDVLEDNCKYNLSHFSFLDEEQIGALRLLTKPQKVDYQTYLSNIANNSLARKIKIADLKHNSDLGRLKNITEKDRQRQGKYLMALNFLAKYEKGNL